jgi:leucyl-tRNA synthetase
VLAKLLAPLTPYLAEELWSALSGEGLIAAADWPTPLHEIPDYRTERDLVRTTLADVREITEVVEITDPDEIELVVAPDWSYRAYETAREVAPDGPVVGRVMEADGVPGTDAAADYAADLAERDGGFEPVLSPERELTVLEQARWLFADEFGAEVVVRQADPDGEQAGRARPNRPAIHIS